MDRRAWRLALLLALVCISWPARADTIYAALGNGDILSVDTEHMTSRVLVQTGICWYDIAFSPQGRLYGSDGLSLYRIDPQNGQTTLLGGFGQFVNAMTFVDDTLYAAGDIGLYTVDLASGQAQMVGWTNFGSSGDLEWFRGALYMTATGLHSDKLVMVDVHDGHATLVGDIGYLWVFGLAAADSGMFAVTSRGELLRLDLTSGAGTLVGSVVGAVNGASGEPGSTKSSVPEPGTLMLLGTGLALGLKPRRRYDR